MIEEQIELYLRVLEDGRTVSVIPLTIGRARITISPPFNPLIYDDEW